MKKTTAKQRVSEPTGKLLKEAGYYPRGKGNDPKAPLKNAMMNTDFNLLENQYVVRKYFQKKFNINLQELEILLYLFPKGYFSHADYKAFPLNFTYRQIVSMMKKGHVKIFHEGRNKDHHIYTLTKSAKHRIMVYYQLLSGELEIPTISENNPMIRKDATAHEKKIINMFHRLKKMNNE